MKRLPVLAILALCAFGGTLALSAQDWQISRTEWGDPDLEGVWISANADRLPFQRVDRDTADAIVLRELVDAGAVEAGLLNEGVPPGPRLDDQRLTVSEWRLSHSGLIALVVDPPAGRLPPLTTEGEARAAGAWRSSILTRGPWNSASDLGPVERCISRGVLRSMLPAFDYHGLEIVQSPGVVVVRTEMIHEARVVPLSDEPPLSPAIRSYMGRSRGYWDGDDLVVETTHLNGRTGAHLNGNETPTSVRLRLVERFARVSADAIEYRVTVDDPGTWTAPWTVAFPMARHDDYQWAEYACHEGNYPLRGILSAARALESR
jgi:hypothetical protein